MFNKKIIYYSLFVLTLVFAWQINTKLIFAQTSADTSTTITEVSSDDLDISSEEVKSPDDNGYWWSKFKLSTKILFTSDAVKKDELKLKQANLELLAAKKLAENNPDAKLQEKLNKALEKYQAKMTKVEEKINALPADKKTELLKKLDEQALKQQEILRNLSAKLPEQVKTKIEALRQERINTWYEKHKANLEQRLTAAADTTDQADKFAGLKAMANLEDLKDALPTEAGAAIEATQNKTRDRLIEKLKNLSTQEKEKVSKYLEEVKLTDVQKIKLTETLSSAPQGSVLGTEAIQAKESLMAKLKEKFNNLDDSQKEKFLQQNINIGQNGEAVKIKIINELRSEASSELKTKLEKLKIEQQEQLKERIKKIDDSDDLDELEDDSRNLPVIRKELEEKKLELLKKEKENNREAEKQRLEILKKKQELERERLKQEQED
ncbi:MAG: hypothetical protein UR94_C0035G0003 [Parcubacteria group bacterium GW2011_GWA2_36_10]|nr:MAG: hypothetical protein UR94_C0035G0003 [Parcubacteria group bacterium GW2011_GWA2_36_10]